VAVYGLDFSVLNGWYQSKLSTSQASNLAPQTSTANQKAAAGVTPPWDVTSKTGSIEELRRGVLASGEFFNTKKSAFSDLKAPDDYKALFDLYVGLKTLSSLAEKAMDKTVSDSDRKFISTRFAEGLAQLDSFYDSMKLDGLALLKGKQVSSADSTVAISRGESVYVTGKVHTGAFDAEVASLTGNVQFTVAVKKNGVTQNIAINLADMGTTTRSMDNVAAHINTALDAAGVLTRFSRVKLGTPDENNIIPGDDYGFKITGISTEVVSFSAVAGSPAIYLAGTSGLNDGAAGQVVKLTDLAAAAPTTAFSTRLEAAPDTTEVPVVGGAPGETRPKETTNPLEIKSSATAADGSVFVVGTTSAALGGAEIKGAHDMVLAKYDSTGKMVWSRVLGAAAEASATTVAVDGSGNVVVAGVVQGVLGTTTDVGGKDSFVAKYDANGVEQWLSRFGGNGDDQPNAVTVAADGTVYVAGKSASAFGGASHLGGVSDGYLRAIDASGTTLSTTRIGGAGDESISSITMASDGNLIIASQEDGVGVIRKLDAANLAGAALWTQSLGALGAGRIGDVAVDGTNVYIAGSAEGSFAPSAPINAYSGGARDAFLVKMTDGAAPTVDYTTFLGSTEDETANAITLDGTKVYLAGKTTGSLPGQTLVGSRDAFAASFNAVDGVLDWATQLSGRNGVSEATGVSVVAGGDSVLDAMGLPAGTLTYSDSRVVTDRTAARDGDFFYISVNGGRREKISIDANDTMRQLTFKINAALVLDGTADVRRATNGDALRISPKEGSTIELFAGADGRDLLKALGMAPGAIVKKASLLNKDATADAPPLFAMDLPTLMSLSDKDTSKTAFDAISHAMTIVQRSYRELTTPSSLTDLLNGGPGKRGGTVPAYLTARLANYTAGLERLGGSSSGGYY
tara:strand:- start:29088 stop:31823 length:2736 start_codon:yes stop_codon:yes gene_type:complete